MSMVIDLSTPLSTKEREYLASRGRYADIERADALTGVDSPPELPEGDGSGLSLQPLGTAEARAQRAELLRRELAALEAADSGEEDDADDDTDEVPPYDAWTVPDLDTELRRRKLSTAGTKPEKVARLEQDDAANAE